MEKLALAGWSDFECIYPTVLEEDNMLYVKLNLIKEDIIKKGYRFSGNFHQFGESGVPVFSDGTCFRASMRAWGRLMANIYSEVDGINYSYMFFYMDDENQNIPLKMLDNLPSAIHEEESLGFIIEEDEQVIQESLRYNMPLFTTDKILKQY